MAFKLQLQKDSFAIAGIFTISRGAKTTAEVLTCILESNGAVGRGECVPYARYGESIDSVMAEIESVRTPLETGVTRTELQYLMKPGAARNAVDCALWDLESKFSGQPAAERLGITAPKPLITAYTVSLGEPEVMAEKAGENAHRPLLKVKVGTSDDESRIWAVRQAAPNSVIILDANEGWTESNLAHHFQVCAAAGVKLVEQPLPAGKDGYLAEIERPITICADESVHDSKDLAQLRDRYDAVNIKLDKTGGLTEGLVMKQQAQSLGFKIMVGCMVGSSLAMAPAVLLAQDADYVDLDGPLLLAQDRDPALRYDGSLVFPPSSALWG